MDKYYTPDPTEFHPNFVFEQRIEQDEWRETKCPFGTVWFTLDDLVGGKIRVKHLDREDIEGEGFEYLGESEHEDPNMCVFDSYSKEIESGLIMIKLFPDINGKPLIDVSYNDGHIFTWHKGYIKNLSEFRKILKQIGVC